MSQYSKDVTALNRDTLKAAGVTLPMTEDEVRTAEEGQEKQLQRDCEQLLRWCDVEFLHLSYRAREKRGWPDLTFVLNGRPMAVELKTRTGKLTLTQIATLERMQANGWHTHVVRGYDEFRALVGRGGRPPV